MARARNNVTLAVTLGQPAAKHDVAPALIHRSTWNRNSRKFISKILHRTAPIPLLTQMDGYARSWMFFSQTVVCASKRVCASMSRILWVWFLYCLKGVH